jgi:hypothetical protein
MQLLQHKCYKCVCYSAAFYTDTQQQSSFSTTATSYVIAAADSANADSSTAVSGDTTESVTEC